MSHRKLKGSITVFASYITIFLIIFLLAIVEVCRVYGMKVQLKSQVELGIQSIFGEYNRELEKRYHIFMIDGWYGKKQDKIIISDRAEWYMKEGLFHNYEEDGKKYFDIWQYNNLSCTIKRKNLAVDEFGSEVVEQAVRYAGKYYKKEQVVVGDNIKRIQSLDSEKTSQNVENIIRSFGGEKIYKVFDYFQKIIGKGILEIVNNVISSNKRLDNSDLVSYNYQNSNSQIINNLDQLFRTDGNIYWINYVKNNFVEFRINKSKKQKNNYHILDYEREYIIYGKESDQNNLEMAVSEIFDIRKNANLRYIKSNLQLQNQLVQLASVIGTLSGSETTVSKIKEFIESVLTYAESLLDIKRLLEGEKVSFEKSEETFCVSLSKLAVFPVLINEHIGDDKNGITYGDYIDMISYRNFSPQQQLRALDIIEKNIQNESKSNNFHLKNCISALELECVLEGKPLFFNMFEELQKYIVDYHFCLNKVYSY